MRIFFTLLLVLGLLQTPVSADEVGSLLVHGKNSASSGAFQQAQKTYQQAFRQNPGDLQINYLLGDAAVKAQDYETAVMAFERVLIINPEAVRAKIELGRTFYRLGARETGRQYLRQALEADLPGEVRRDIVELLKQ